MTYKEFWQLIDNAREAKGTSPETILIEQLSQCDQQAIIDFEYMLREFLAQLHHRTIVDAYKTTVDRFSSDGYLYFRCWIIGQGKDYMEELLNATTIMELSKNIYEFEMLLYVADTAFEKNGFEGDSPRDLGYQYLNYDGNAIPLKG